MSRSHGGERRVLFVVALGTLLSSMSGSIVNVILPKIGAWAGVGMGTIEWAVLVTLITASAGLLTAGSFGDIFGHRRVYLAGIVVVGIGSLGCALAPGFGAFLAFRGLQGIGAAALMAASPALITLNVPASRRGRDLGMVSTATYVGLTVAPPIGGLLDTLWSFKSVFWMQTGAMLVLGVITWAVLPGDSPGARDGRPARKPDLAGAALVAIGLTGVTLALARGDIWGLLSVETLVSLSVGLAAIAGFVAWEIRIPAPVFDVRLLGDRMLLSSFLGAFLHYFAMFQVVFLLPFYLEDLLSLSTSEAGLYLMIMPSMMALTAWPSGHLSDRLGSRVLSSAGMAGVAAALVLLTWTSSDSSAGYLAICLATLGLGAGIFVSPNTNALLTATPRASQGTGGGLLALTRNLGMLVGTAVSAAVFELARGAAARAGESDIEAAMHGLHMAYAVGIALAVVGAVVVLTRPARVDCPDR